MTRVRKAGVYAGSRLGDPVTSDAVYGCHVVLLRSTMLTEYGMPRRASGAFQANDDRATTRHTPWSKSQPSA